MVRKIGTALAVVGLLVVGACKPEASSQQQEAQKQEQVIKNALNSLPAPSINQYPTRKTVIRWLEHANNPDQTHYVYVMLPGVGYLGYYVADSAPVNICTSLTSPVREYDVGGGAGPHPIGPAPALDGVYYAGASCDKWYFFDKSTNAKLEVGGNMAFFVSSQPLVLDVPELRVKKISENESE